MRLSSIASKVFLDPVDVFTYASSYGKPALRSSWKESIYRKNPSLRAKISTPVVTNALTHGLSVAGYMFVDKADKIILPDKNWENYNLIFKEGCGAVMDTYNTFSEGSLDLGDFRRALSAGIGKKIVLLNFPNNPSGYTPTYDEALEIVSAIRDVAEAGDKIVVLVDDAYFGFVYEDGIYKESIFSMLADLHENVLAVKLDGATKESYAWGLRVGFITFGFKGATEEDYKVLEDKAAGVVRCI
jgi:aspartate/methionine/tyrosine aminotransferase